MPFAVVDKAVMHMLRVAPMAVGVCLFSMMVGCSCGDGGSNGRRDGGPDSGEPDSGAVDAGVDAGTDAGQDGGRLPGRDLSTTFVTSGGVSASSPRYRLRFSVGAPQPMGEAEGAGGELGSRQRILLGPAATPR
jgi:hypothetical protein